MGPFSRYEQSFHELYKILLLSGAKKQAQSIFFSFHQLCKKCMHVGEPFRKIYTILFIPERVDKRTQFYRNCRCCPLEIYLKILKGCLQTFISLLQKKNKKKERNVWQSIVFFPTVGSLCIQGNYTSSNLYHVCIGIHPYLSMTTCKWRKKVKSCTEVFLRKKRSSQL